MKKAISIILCVVAIISLSACGAPKQVPDQTIAWVVEDYLKECGYGTVSDFSYDAVHSYDSSTKTDTVDIALSAEFPTASFTTSYSATYQYDKSSDLWSVIRGGIWQPVTISSYKLTASPQSLLAIIQKTDESAEIDNYTLRNMLALETQTEAVDNWYIEGNSTVFGFCESVNSETAYNVFLKALYELCLEERINDFASKNIETAVGENYHCVKWYDNGFHMDVYMICQDRVYFLFGGDNTATSKNITDSIGFIPEMVWVPFDVKSDLKGMLYKKAESALASEDYDYALEMFTKLDDYKDSASRAEESVQAMKAAKYAEAEGLLEKGEFVDAKALFLELEDYQDSAAKASEADKAINANRDANIKALVNFFSCKSYDDVLQCVHFVEPSRIQEFEIFGRNYSWDDPVSIGTLPLAGEEGKSRVRLELDTDGKIKRISIIYEIEYIDEVEEALNAIYGPGTKDNDIEDWYRVYWGKDVIAQYENIWHTRAYAEIRG